MSNTAIERRNDQLKTIKNALERAKGSIAAVAARHMTPDRLLKVALAAAQRQPKLLECEALSLVRAVVGCAELGLEPNALGHAYLVPYGKEAQLIIGYRGLLELAYRSKRIIDVTCECVFEGDEFSYRLGTDTEIDHVPGGEDDAKKITHAYCVIRMADGGRVVKVMTKSKVDRIRSRSKAGSSGPWVTDYEEMARKTVLRNALKYAPMSIEMAKAESADIATDTGDPTAMNNFEWLDAEATELEPTEPTKGNSALKDKIAAPAPDDDSEPYTGPVVTDDEDQGELV